MRTTVEIDERLHSELLRIARERGEQGLSGVVSRALEDFVRQHHGRCERVARALEQRGALSGDEADSLEASVGRLRGSWT